LEGRIVQIAFLQGSRVSLDLLPLMLKRMTFTGSTLRPRTVAQKATIARALAAHVVPLLAAGRCLPRIDSVSRLEQVREAHARMDEGSHIGKIVLVTG